jgi:hypothetical protein
MPVVLARDTAARDYDEIARLDGTGASPITVSEGSR